MAAMVSMPQLRLGRPGAMGRTVSVARVVGLVALVWASANQHSEGGPRVPALLLGLTALAWVGWLICLRVTAPIRTTWLTLAVLATAGAAVGGLAPVGITFPAVAVIATATQAGLAPTIVVAGLGA